jgi:hypothetical protein
LVSGCTSVVTGEDITFSSERIISKNTLAEKGKITRKTLDISTGGLFINVIV